MTSISALSGYRLQVEFEDGVSGIVDLTDDLFGPFFEALKDETLFAQVRIDEFGAPCWPNGADIAPDAVYADLTGKPVSPHVGRQGPVHDHKGL